MSVEHIEVLDLIATGDWFSAHTLIQEYNDELACLIHAYLHREEGDLSNANYWYGRVGQNIPDNSLEEEFEHVYRLAQDSEKYSRPA